MGTSGICRNGLPVVDAVGPFLGSSSVHVGHGPLNFGLFIRKLIRTQAEVSLAVVLCSYSTKSTAGDLRVAMGCMDVWMCGSRKGSPLTPTTPSEIMSVKMSFIMVWKVAGLLVSPKNITSGSNIPLLVWKAAFHLSPSLIHTLLKPTRRPV